MNINVRQTVFIVVGLAIITAAFLFSKLNHVQASKKEGTKFDDWMVRCVPNDPKNAASEQDCFLTQQVTAQQKDEKQKDVQQVIAVYQIGYGNDKVLRMIQVLPLGVALQPGTSIINSKNLIAPGQFTNCTQTGCQAVAVISDDDLKKIITNSENSVAFMNGEGKQVNLPLSNKGLQNGLDYLK